MAVVATILIITGALIGIFMAAKAVRHRHIPKGLALFHGTAVVSGVILLFLFALTTDSPDKHWDILIIFLIAAAGGVYLLQRDIRHKRFPLWIMFVHALIGLSGLVWLIIHLAG